MGRKVMDVLEALKRYGTHDDLCNYYGANQRRCDCGLEAAIKQRPWDEAAWKVKVKKMKRRSPALGDVNSRSMTGCDSNYPKW